MQPSYRHLFPERKKSVSAVRQLSGSVLLQCFFTPLGVLLVTKTLEDEWNVDLKAYKFTVFEILRDFLTTCIYVLRVHTIPT